MVVTRRARFALLAAAAMLAVAIAASPSASAPAMAASASPCARHAPEAAARSRLPAATILRVMHVESRGRPGAVSPKGAMGCMQIMPATWRYLTMRHGLGADPWDPRMNMIGGALYLAELAERFGFPGAYSAYNAGPARYARHLATGAPLPRETRLYTASLTGKAVAPESPPDRSALSAPMRWQESGLFTSTQEDRQPDHAAAEADDPAPAQGETLFPLARAVPRREGGVQNK